MKTTVGENICYCVSQTITSAQKGTLGNVGSYPQPLEVGEGCWESVPTTENIVGLCEHMHNRRS